jgi:hypothetical protein
LNPPRFATRQQTIRQPNNVNFHVETYSVPEKYVGAILGRGGYKIRHIRQTSCATVMLSTFPTRVNKDDDADDEDFRVITVKGTRGQVDSALKLLREVVAECMEVEKVLEDILQ